MRVCERIGEPSWRESRSSGWPWRPGPQAKSWGAPDWLKQPGSGAFGFWKTHFPGGLSGNCGGVPNRVAPNRHQRGESLHPAPGISYAIGTSTPAATTSASFLRQWAGDPAIAKLSMTSSVTSSTGISPCPKRPVNCRSKVSENPTHRKIGLVASNAPIPSRTARRGFTASLARRAGARVLGPPSLGWRGPAVPIRGATDPESRSARRRQSPTRRGRRRYRPTWRTPWRSNPGYIRKKRSLLSSDT